MEPVSASECVKTTAQRELIVDVFFERQHRSFPCVDRRALASVRLRNPKVGYATVYRTVKHLLDAGLAASRQFGDGQTRYEVAGSDSPHHDHLICQRCRLILEFEEPEIERLQDSVAARLGGFKVIQHKLELYGLCQKSRAFPAAIVRSKATERRMWGVWAMTRVWGAGRVVFAATLALCAGYVTLSRDSGVAATRRSGGDFRR